MTAQRPRVILHNAVSLDGRLDGFEADLDVYYETAGRLGAQATLSGSTTILTGFAGSEDGDPPPAPPPAGPDRRPLLAIVDSRGRIRFWKRICSQPYWRGVIALASRATPTDALENQRLAGVDTLVAGARRVDLSSALEQLAGRYDVSVVRVDSGGRLNGALLRAGLVDEVSLLIHPTLVGTSGKLPLVSGRIAPFSSSRMLAPTHLEELRGRIVWVRCQVTDRPRASDGTLAAA
jgi:2,5-diamino-6-(ribosylamino)-4(3H)-pyrimidinone 5'-phosphate reductase